MNVLDLFCGAGGLSYGFKKAGYNILLGIDNDPIVLKTFKLNHPESKILCKDISKIDEGKILKEVDEEKIDIIIGGPPCQGFSLAGKRESRDPRNYLIKHFLRIVSEIKPKIFIIENVPGLLSMKTEKGNRFLDEIKRISKNNGFFIKELLLNAEEYGIPQKRKRIFLIGSREEKANFDLKKQKKKTVKNILLPKEKVPKEYFYSQRMIQGFKRREIKNKKKGWGYGWKFLESNKRSYTISARYYKDGAEALIKYSETKIRKLTPEECALIQSFPKKYKFQGNKREIYRQIGNAVPPKLSYVIAKSIKRQKYLL